jgi:hypothetical protein
LKRVPKGKFICAACKEQRRWRMQVRGVALRFGARHNHAAAAAAAPHLSQVEKAKCKLLDLEAKQSDDCDTSEGDDSHGLQTQVHTCGV